MRETDEPPVPADGGKDSPPTRMKITFNGTAEELENLMAMIEKLRLPDLPEDQAAPAENQYSALKGGARTTAQAQANPKKETGNE